MAIHYAELCAQRIISLYWISSSCPLNYIITRMLQTITHLVQMYERSYAQLGIFCNAKYMQTESRSFLRTFVHNS